MSRQCYEAVLYRYQVGIPWRDLPERFGDFRKVHTRFRRWAKMGVWQRVLQNFFAKLKQYRAIATRYDKLAETFLGAIYMAAALIWLN
ncbi:MAG: hypothetical protein OHK0037_33560 [Elainellaceae cyanobacterium]